MLIDSLCQSANILTSNILYSDISNALNKFLNTRDSILIVPVIGDSDLMVIVEATGMAPPSLQINNFNKEFSKLHSCINKNTFENDITLKDYDYIVKIQNSSSIFAYFLFKGEFNIKENDLIDLIEKITHLFKIKDAVDSLPRLEGIQSKLKYQMSFFSSTINNVFEPYGLQMLLQLYMEIVSEMFIMPSAITLEKKGDRFIPLFSKGASLNKYKDFFIEASPFLKNRSLGIFPTIVDESVLSQFGDHNSEILNINKVRLIIPLSSNNQLNYMLICMRDEEKDFDYQDKVILHALSNILNRALEYSEVKQSLMEKNNELDRKVFTLTSVYRAAEKIFSSVGIAETLNISLDMLMELFQSAISSTVIYNSLENRYEMVKLKSAFDIESFSYWFSKPTVKMNYDKTIYFYHKEDDRKEFLEIFPEFLQFEEKLQAHLIVQLFHSDIYYGFITLSYRVINKDYSSDDIELLNLLVRSIVLAVDNARLFKEKEKNFLILQERLENILAIQEILQIIRKASNSSEFIQLLSNALKLGLNIKDMAMAYYNQDMQFTLIYGEIELQNDEVNNLLNIKNTTLLTLDNKKILAFPMFTKEKLKAVIFVKDFNDSILESQSKIQLLEIISAIISDKLINLLEDDYINEEECFDYSKYIFLRIKEKWDELFDFGLKPNIILIKDTDINNTLFLLNEIREYTFKIHPELALIISISSEDIIQEALSSYTHIVYNSLAYEDIFIPNFNI